jgi:hypothetical protein
MFPKGEEMSEGFTQSPAFHPEIARRADPVERNIEVLDDLLN